MVVGGVWDFPRKNKAGLQSSRERARGEGAVIFYFCLFLPRFSYLFHFFYFYIFTFYILLVKTRPVWRREGEGGAVASQLAHGSSMASELMTWAGTIDQPSVKKRSLKWEVLLCLFRILWSCGMSTERTLLSQTQYNYTLECSFTIYTYLFMRQRETFPLTKT